MKLLFLKILRSLISRFHYFRIKLSILITRQNVNNKNEMLLLKKLQSDGFVKIKDPKFLNLANIIEKNFFTNDKEIFDQSDKNILKRLSTTANSIGNHSCRISFKDKNVASVLLDKKVITILNGYLGRFYYRENPLLEYFEFKNPAEATRDIVPYAVSFHSDYYRQINVMLLLSDVTENDTCTEYAIGSNQRNVFIQGSNIGYPIGNSIIKENRYSLKKLTGKKGDLIIMDTTGIHRVCVQDKSKRKLLVGVLNCNYPFLGYSENITKLDINDSNIKINPSAVKFNPH